MWNGKNRPPTPFKFLLSQTLPRGSPTSQIWDPLKRAKTF